MEVLGPVNNKLIIRRQLSFHELLLCTRQLIQSYAYNISCNHLNDPAMAGIIIASLQMRQMRLIFSKDKASKYKSRFKSRPV